MEYEADIYANYAENNLSDVVWGKGWNNWCICNSIDEWQKMKDIPITTDNENLEIPF